MVSAEEIQELIEKAALARENAFVPRSDHKIGACIATTDGAIFAGCNVESNISGLGTCAERNAVDNAITNGKYEYKAVLTLDTEQTLPCGTCLQYLYEFYSINENDITVISADTGGRYTQYSLVQLLPHGYMPHHDIEKIKAYKNK